MKIEYKSTKTFTEKEPQRLFLSVNWESGNYPDKLVRAMQHSTHVILRGMETNWLDLYAHLLTEKLLHFYIIFW